MVVDLGQRLVEIENCLESAETLAARGWPQPVEGFNLFFVPALPGGPPGGVFLSGIGADIDLG